MGKMKKKLRNNYGTGPIKVSGIVKKRVVTGRKPTKKSRPLKQSSNVYKRKKK